MNVSTSFIVAFIIGGIKGLITKFEGPAVSEGSDRSHKDTPSEQ